MIAEKTVFNTAARENLSLHSPLRQRTNSFMEEDAETIEDRTSMTTDNSDNTENLEYWEEPLTPLNKRKRVSFKSTAFVVLIPTSSEYKEVGLRDTLWWSENDFCDFKISTLEEIKQIMHKNPGMSLKAATRLYFKLLDLHLTIPAVCSKPQEGILLSGRSPMSVADEVEGLLGEPQHTFDESAAELLIVG